MMKWTVYTIILWVHFHIITSLFALTGASYVQTLYRTFFSEKNVHPVNLAGFFFKIKNEISLPFRIEKICCVLFLAAQQYPR